MLRALFHLRYIREIYKGNVSYYSYKASTFTEGLDMWWTSFHNQFFILLLCIALIAFTIEGMLYLRKKRNLLK